MRDGSAEELATTLGLDPGSLRLIARIHATVELERALAEHGRPLTDLAGATEDALLGARVVVAAGPDGGTVALAEPSTEGRLAASLARHGEGPAGAYYEISSDGLDGQRVRVSAAGVQLSRATRGPFGREALVLGGPLGGPNVILVEAAAVPSPR